MVLLATHIDKRKVAALWCANHTKPESRMRIIKPEYVDVLLLPENISDEEVAKIATRFNGYRPWPEHEPGDCVEVPLFHITTSTLPFHVYCSSYQYVMRELRPALEFARAIGFKEVRVYEPYQGGYVLSFTIAIHDPPVVIDASPEVPLLSAKN